ncbi:MAG: hypothetical protein M1819_001839 [Sarea resinae]|nr:MAG: hypothetical protein M1819_001839 [Sarea resinae]
MLKSTHRSLNAPAPLPPGWTEHKAPTGHSYYYNAETKQSTYTRPFAPPQYSDPTPQDGSPIPTYSPNPYSNIQNQFPVAYPQQGFPADFRGATPYSSHVGERGGYRGRGGFRDSQGYQRRRHQPEDRPKSKHIIPGCSPWLLVKTKLRRRFVYNPEKEESFWKFPEDVMKGVVEFDKIEREERERRKRGEESGLEDEQAIAAEEIAEAAKSGPPQHPSADSRRRSPGEEEAEEEYEDEEYTEDEDDQSPWKRQKTGEDGVDQPVDFNEDDIAYQLAAMGQDYGLDPAEYGEDEAGEWEEGAEGLPLTKEDSSALFKDLLDDFNINPYSIWDKVIEEGNIIDDDRYTVLPNMKSRREVWDEWSREKIQKLKEQKEKEEKKDPRIPYLAFLQSHATPKLYWPEFRRKFKKEPEMRDPKLSDKDREKYYREHISRLKLPPTTQKADLLALLKSLPLSALNVTTSTLALPPALLTDIRYITLPTTQRDAMIETYISTLPPAPSGTSLLSPEEEEAQMRQREERERREKALKEREERLREQKRIEMRRREAGRGALREGEEELERAMRVGKAGLLGQLGRGTSRGGDDDAEVKVSEGGTSSPS